MTAQPEGDAARGPVVEVEDTGIGMSVQQQAGLSQAFSEADPSFGRCFGSTGLGLAPCRRLSEATGGTIAEQSALGKGSRFTVRLPLECACPPVLEAEQREFGCEAQVAGEEGEAGIDVLFMDLNTPGMDGYELARVVRWRWPSLPVAAVTADATL